MKVSDLLLSPGSTDTVVIDERPLIDLVGMIGWLSGQISLLWLTKTDIQTTLTIKGIFTTCCDKCGKEYERIVEVVDEVAKFSGHTDTDEDFVLDIKTGSIDTIDMVYQAVKLLEPVVLYCDNCQIRESDLWW